MNDENKIKEILTIRAPQRVSPDFTQRVMEQIEASAPAAELPKRHRSRWAIAAAVTAFVVICASAAFIGIRQYQSREDAPLPSPIVTEEATPQAQQLQPLSYQNARLEQVIDDLCQRYDCEAIYANEAAKDINLHITIEADASLPMAVEIINEFDEINICLQNDSTIVVK